MSFKTITSAQNSVNVNRGLFNSTAKCVQATEKQIASPAAIEALNRSLVKLENLNDRLLAGYLALSELQTEKDKIDKALADIESQNKTFGDWQTEILNKISEWTQVLDKKQSAATKAAAATPTSPAATATPKPQFKVQSALKPDVLTPSATPAELEHWKRSFKAFYNVSHLEELPIPDQQQFVMTNVDSELSNYLAGKVDSTTEVLGDAPSLMAFLDERFALKYPLFTRRLQYYRYQQQSGQTYSDFRSKLGELRRQADIETLSADEMEVFRIICGISNKDLREKILKLDNPTLEQVEKEALVFESTQANLKACNKQQGAATAARVSGTDGPQAGSLKDVCNKCGHTGPTHKKEDCPASGSLCSYCKQQGHWKSNKGLALCPQMRQSLEAQDHPGSTSGRGGGRRGRGRGRGGHRGGGRGDGHSDESQEKVAQADANTDDDLAKANVVHVRTVRLAAASRANQPTPRFQLNYALPNSTTATTFQALPDSGATMTVISQSLVSGCQMTSTKLRLVAANDESMIVTGTVDIWGHAPNAPHTRGPTKITALVSTDLQEDILVSWYDMISLGILHPEFPNGGTEGDDSTVVTTVDQMKTETSTLLKDLLDSGIIVPVNGRYQYIGAPMGLHSSGDAFCQKADAPLEGRHPLTSLRKAGVTLSKKVSTWLDSIKSAKHLLRKCVDQGLRCSVRLANKCN